MKCPKCGKSLWFVQNACPFCKANLQSPAPPQASSSTVEFASDLDSAAEPELVTLRDCANLAEADAIRQHLESKGIPVFLPEENTAQTLFLKLGTFLRVQVHARDVTAAQAALANLPQVPQSIPLADQPLRFPEKWGALVLGLICCVGWLVFLSMHSGFVKQGYARKARQSLYWFLAGLACWIVVYYLMIAIGF